MLHLNYFYKNGELCLEMNDIFMDYVNIYRQIKLAYYQQTGMNISSVDEVINLPTPSSDDLKNTILPKFEIIDRVLPPFVIKRDFKTWWYDCLDNDLCKWLDKVVDNYMYGFTIMQESSKVSNYYRCFMIQDEYANKYNFFEKFLMYICMNNFWLIKNISADQIDDLTVRASIYFANLYHANEQVMKLHDSIEERVTHMENIEIRVDNCNNMLKDRIDDLEGIVHNSTDIIPRIENVEISADDMNRRVNKLEDVVSKNMDSTINKTIEYHSNIIDEQGVLINEQVARIDEQQARIDEQGARINEYSTRLDEYIIQSEERINKLENVVSGRIEDRLSHLEGKINVNFTLDDTLVQRVNKLEDVVSRVNVNNGSADNSIVERINKLENYMERLVMVENKLDNNLVNIEKLTESNNKLSVSNMTLEQQVNNMQKNIIDQQNVIYELRKRIDELEAKQSKRWFFK